MKINRNPTAKDIFYAAIIESSNDAIIGKELNGTIISWNKAAENLYGYTAKEIIGLSIDYLMPTDRKYETQQILTKIKEGKKIDHYETIHLKRDGAEIKVSVSGSPIKDDSGRIIGAASIIREIPFVTPEQKKFELAVEAAPNGMLIIDALGEYKACK